MFDITFNGNNSERFPPIKKDLAYYFPLDETFQCCVQDFKFMDILCVRETDATDGDLYKKFFLELRSNVKIAYSSFTNLNISFTKGEYNAIAIDFKGNEITDDIKKALQKISKDNQIPILVLNDSLDDDVYVVGGVSVLYFTVIPSDDTLLKYIEKGIRIKQAYSYKFLPNCLLVTDNVSIPIHSEISDFTISASFRLNTTDDNNLIFSLNDSDNKIISLVYNKNNNIITAEFKQEKVLYKINLNLDKYYRISITKRNRLLKIYLDNKKIIEYQYDAPIKIKEIILGCSGYLGYTHITNNFYKDLWIYNNYKDIEDIEILSKSISSVL